MQRGGTLEQQGAGVPGSRAGQAGGKCCLQPVAGTGAALPTHSFSLPRRSTPPHRQRCAPRDAQRLPGRLRTSVVLGLGRPGGRLLKFRAASPGALATQ